jgi:hypothetical protein
MCVCLPLFKNVKPNQRNRDRSAVVMGSGTVTSKIQRYRNNFKLFYYEKSQLNYGAMYCNNSSD